MLSSVSYVCLGVCAGMWVISRGIYLGGVAKTRVRVTQRVRVGGEDKGKGGGKGKGKGDS